MDIFPGQGQRSGPDPHQYGSGDVRQRQRDRHGRIREPIEVEFGPSELRVNAELKSLIEGEGTNVDDGGINSSRVSRVQASALASIDPSASPNGRAVKKPKGKPKRPARAPVEEFGKCYDDERLMHDTAIIKALEIRDNRLVVATATVGPSLRGFSICSNCNTAARPPTSCCSEGHIMCGYCAENEQIYDCPRLVPGPGAPKGPIQVACKAHVSPCPLELYKHFFNTSIYFCPYKSDGCPEKYPGAALDTHINNCEFRPSVRCPFSLCAVGMVEPRHFFDHLAEHGALSYRSNAVTVKAKHARRAVLPSLTRDFRWVAAHFHAGKLDFLLLVQESKDELYLWIQLFSKANMLSERMFISRLTMRIPGSPRELEWCGDVLRSELDMDLISKPDCTMVVRKAPFERYFMYRGEAEDDNSYFNVDVLIDQVVLNQQIPDAGSSESARRRLENLKPSYRLDK